MKILSELSKSFQQDKLCITDVVANLETTVIMLEDLKLQRGAHYRKFVESYSEETAVFMCGKDKGHQLKLTNAGNMLDQHFSYGSPELLEDKVWKSSGETLQLVQNIRPTRDATDPSGLWV